MKDIKELTDKIYHAAYSRDVIDANIEMITSVDRTLNSKIDEQKEVLEKIFNSKIAEQKENLEKAQQIIDKKILHLRISVVVLSILLVVSQCQQIVAQKSVKDQIQEYNQMVEQNTQSTRYHNQILEENNRLMEEIIQNFNNQSGERGGMRDVDA